MILSFKRAAAGFRRPVATLALVATCLLLTGCVEQSTVVKVKPDGSGLIHIRVHQQDATLFGLVESKNKAEDKVSTKELLAELVKKMGTGVEIVSSVEKANRHGWPGHELIVRFDDINQVTIPGNLLTKPISPKKKNAKNKPSSLDLKGDTKFTFNNGVLKIQMNGFDEQANADELVVEGAVDPFAAEPASPLAKMSLPDLAIQAMASELLADARVGFFVQIDGEVIESNAKFRKDNLVTLVQANFGEILKTPQGLSKLESLENETKKVSRKLLSTLSDSIPGLDIDLQNPIEIRFK